MNKPTTIDQALTTGMRAPPTKAPSGARVTIPETFSKASTWKRSQSDPERGKLFVEAGRLAHDILMQHPARWLTMAGASGCGKTHLAREIFAWIRAQRLDAFRAIVSEEMQEAPCGYDGPTIWQRRRMDFITAQECARSWKKGAYGLSDDLADTWLLVIDDLGSERDPSGFLADQWFDVLNRRMGKWTIITCNLLGDQISEKLDERIASRMTRDGNVLLESKATDYFA